MYGGLIWALLLLLLPRLTEGVTTTCQHLAPTPYEYTVPTCDCGVIWKNLGSPSSTTDSVTTNTLVNLINDELTAIPAADVEQARFMCFKQTQCSGFLYETVTGVEPYAYFFDYSRTAGSLTASPGLEAVYLPTTALHIIERYENNRCSDFTLDAYYYYFSDSNRRNHIETYNSGQFCPFPLTLCGTCCWSTPLNTTHCTSPESPSRSQAAADISQTWAAKALAHWNEIGSALRLPPNSACSLTPTLWTAESQCETPQTGCFESDQQPCGGNGYCDANDNNPYASGLYSTPYYCNCNNFTGNDQSGNPLFDHNFQYMGNACQRSSLLLCTNAQNPNQLCSGFASRCTPQLLANTAPNNDYNPVCDCDTAPAVAGTGQYCQTNRCDPLTRCQSLGGNSGSCQFVSNQWKCVCQSSAVGPTCQYSTLPCKNNPADIFNCAGRGVCMPPGLDSSLYPVSVYDNFNANAVWCACTNNLAFGTKCQSLICNPAIVTAGRGTCQPATGGFVGCLAAYKTSGLPGTLLCDIDICATTGGTATPVDNPTSCACGLYQPGTALTPPLTDISCYPVCAISNGTVCGPATAPKKNLCIQSVDTSGVRRSQCVCDFGYIQVTAPLGSAANQAILGGIRAPVNQLPLVCEPWCLHGTPPTAWTSSNLLPCICPNTGFNTANNHPRCDNAICQNGGVWNTGTQRCDCVGPYISSGNCQFDTCSNPNTPLIVEGTPLGAFCSCRAPFTWANTLTKLECLADRCGANGRVNPQLYLGNTAIAAADYCVCTSSLYRTSCLDATGLTCSYCSTPSCQNGGVLIASGTNVLGCSCVFPWTGATCSSNLCGSKGTPTAISCVCAFGFTGARCDIAPCSAYGRWNNATNTACVCTLGWTGTLCQNSPCPTGFVWNIATLSCVAGAGGGGGGTPVSSSGSAGSSSSSTGRSSSTAVAVIQSSDAHRNTRNQPENNAAITIAALVLGTTAFLLKRVF